MGHWQTACQQSPQACYSDCFNLLTCHLKKENHTVPMCWSIMRKKTRESLLNTVAALLLFIEFTWITNKISMWYFSQLCLKHMRRLSKEQGLSLISLGLVFFVYILFVFLRAIGIYGFTSLVLEHLQPSSLQELLPCLLCHLSSQEENCIYMTPLHHAFM